MSLAEAKSDRPVDVVGGNLRIRLAEDTAEIRAAQALRYRVFYESMAARPTPEMAAARRDFDSFDDFCDHLLVFDVERGSGAGAVVGTYRVMRREGAARRGQFYTSDEYQIDCLTSYPGEILELGRTVREVPIDQTVQDHLIRVVRGTHSDNENAPADVKRFVRYGASPRGAQAILAASRARALLQGRFHVAREDVNAMAIPALRHRLVLSFEGEAEGINTDDIIRSVIEKLK